MKKEAILIVYPLPDRKYIPLKKVSWPYRAEMVSFQSSQASAGQPVFKHRVTWRFSAHTIDGDGVYEIPPGKRGLREPSPENVEKFCVL